MWLLGGREGKGGGSIKPKLRPVRHKYLTRPWTKYGWKMDLKSKVTKHADWIHVIYVGIYS